MIHLESYKEHKIIQQILDKISSIDIDTIDCQFYNYADGWVCEIENYENFRCMIYWDKKIVLTDNDSLIASKIFDSYTSMVEWLGNELDSRTDVKILETIAKESKNIISRSIVEMVEPFIKRIQIFLSSGFESGFSEMGFYESKNFKDSFIEISEQIKNNPFNEKDFKIFFMGLGTNVISIDHENEDNYFHIGINPRKLKLTTRNKELISIKTFENQSDFYDWIGQHILHSRNFDVLSLFEKELRKTFKKTIPAPFEEFMKNIRLYKSTSGKSHSKDTEDFRNYGFFEMLRFKDFK